MTQNLSHLPLGRKPRAFSARIPHMSALMAGVVLPPISRYAHYADVLPADMGMMLNDQLGDCTCAAVYHARLLWRKFAGAVEEMASDDLVRSLYERFGYDPSNPATDQGAVEQDVLSSWVRDGITVGAGAIDRLAAFIEVDPRNPDDICRAIWECGVAYIGINIPSGFMETVPEIWDANPAYGAIEGGHAIVLVGFDQDAGTYDLISWGQKYQVTRAFLAQYCDEVYALVDEGWVETTGKTPLGMSIADLEAQAAAIRMAT